MNLEFKEPIKYRITLSNIEIKTHEIYNNGKYIPLKSFISPATIDNTFKVYIVKKDEMIIYIGITSQGIGKRFGQGFRANSKQGYHGYHWKEIDGNLEVLIWISNFQYEKRFDEDHKKQSKIMEGIEGEIVYQFRKENKEWPACQNEIHFHNVNKQYKDFAKLIYDKSK